MKFMLEIDFVQIHDTRIEFTRHVSLILRSVYKSGFLLCTSQYKISDPISAYIL
jgi:hypothetical protein